MRPAVELIFEKGDGRYSAYAKNFPSKIAMGKTLAEAIGNLIIEHSTLVNIGLINVSVEKEEALINIQDKAKLIPIDSEKDLKARDKILEPVNRWASSQLIKVEKSMTAGLTLERWCHAKDNEYRSGMSQEERDQHNILIENEDIKIVGALDYDFGYSMGKFTIYSKLTNLKVRHTMMFKILD